MYRITKLVQKTINEIDELVEEPHKRKEELVIRPAAAYIKDEYIKKYHPTGYFSVNAICSDAIENGYLKQGLTSDRGGLRHDGITEIDNLEITAKGRGLIDTAFWIIPIGLLSSWWDKYGVFISGAVVGLLTAPVIILAKWLISH